MQRLGVRWGACARAGKQASSGEPLLQSLLATRLPGAAGTWATQVTESKSSPAPVYSRFHWAALNRCK